MKCPFDKLPIIMSCLARLLPLLVTAASIATAAIPNPSPETAAILKIIHNILDVLALNSIGHNANPGGLGGQGN